MKKPKKILIIIQRSNGDVFLSLTLINALYNNLPCLPNVIDLIGETSLEEVSDERVEEICKKVNIDKFISELPEGLQTEIGENGVKLSGGQKQRVALGRALMTNPEILILDEATSALDTESERKVQGAIDNLVKDRTVIVIAHRLSTITTANQIIVLDKGTLVEFGTHKELLAKNGKYKKYV